MPLDYIGWPPLRPRPPTRHRATATPTARLTRTRRRCVCLVNSCPLFVSHGDRTRSFCCSMLPPPAFFVRRLASRSNRLYGGPPCTEGIKMQRTDAASLGRHGRAGQEPITKGKKKETIGDKRKHARQSDPRPTAGASTQGDRDKAALSALFLIFFLALIMRCERNCPKKGNRVDTIVAGCRE